MALRTARLELERLGSRLAPSAGVLVSPGHPPAAHAAHAPPHPVRGTGGGTFDWQFGDDGGPAFGLSGTADLAGFGRVRVDGWVHGVGADGGGRATGELILSGPRGTLTLALHGPPQPAYSPFPPEFVYTVSGGASGYGAVAIGFATALVWPDAVPVGSMSLSFS
jgi:hypothetical protein